MNQPIESLAPLFLLDVPLLDVRAPVEFAKGAFPGAVNLPLMNDTERQQVGTCYKQRGQEAAIALGHQLVCGQTKADRIAAWHHFATQQPQGMLYCFRGGLRSKISQQWLLDETGVDYPRVTGGYKAMRQFLLDTLAQALQQTRFMVLGGLTGCGKTEVLAQLPNSLDLEAHANHRGSSFGKRTGQQPAQIDFENRLSIDILKKRAVGIQQFILEDEGHFIGRCALPVELHQHMQNYPLVWLEDNLENRMQRILQTYVVAQCAEYRVQYGEEAGFAKYAEGLLSSLGNIHKRLGGDRYQQLLAIMQTALQTQRYGSSDLHLGWIEPLLTGYFDPMYRHQREQKSLPLERFFGSGYRNRHIK
jgi:tRNA 2-selenouridine synthase